MELPGSEESNISANLNKTSTLSGQPILNPQNILKNIRWKNLNRLILVHLNNDSIRNKFDLLVTIVNKNILVFLISETKIDSSFLTVQFHIERYTTPYRLERDKYGGGMLLYIRKKITSSLLNYDVSIETFFEELNLRKKKWLLCYSYNLNKNQISNHLK